MFETIARSRFTHGPYICGNFLVAADRISCWWPRHPTIELIENILFPPGQKLHEIFIGDDGSFGPAAAREHVGHLIPDDLVPDGAETALQIGDADSPVQGNLA